MKAYIVYSIKELQTMLSNNVVNLDISTTTYGFKDTHGMLKRTRER